MNLTENSNFRLFAENGNSKLPFVFCKRKRENRSLFSLVSNSGGRSSDKAIFRS